MHFHEAIRIASGAKATRNFPDENDSRARGTTLFPVFKPKFSLNFDSTAKMFTIGSCFARNIEEALSPFGVVLPTLGFSVPKSEWPARPNGLLNQYNPGTMSQQILFAFEGKSFGTETIVPSGTLFADLLLQTAADVTWERAVERRKEIQQVYSHLSSSSAVIITLGFVEAWFDEETGTYLNRMPPHSFCEKHPHRFSFRRLDVDESMSLLERAVDRICQRGIKVILSVSPVPLNTTFSGDDCVVANEFSKSVLRVCAGQLARRPDVDYFPAYEIVRSSGLQNYENDHIHVKDQVTRQVTQYMVECYQSAWLPRGVPNLMTRFEGDHRGDPGARTLPEEGAALRQCVIEHERAEADQRGQLT